MSAVMQTKETNIDVEKNYIVDKYIFDNGMKRLERLYALFHQIATPNFLLIESCASASFVFAIVLSDY